jgi:phage baseplate assembly protein gpV
MATKNLIKKEDKFGKTYYAKVVSNDDPLRRGRLQVTVDAILGEIPFWVNATLVAGKVRLLLIPEPEDIVSISFKNKDIYSGEWELKGSPVNGTEENYIDPKKYGLSDNQGNFVIIDRATNDISINSSNNFNVTAAGIANIVITGDANVQCANANITAETTTINGNVTINGNTTMNGTLTVSDTCTFEGIAWKPHGHPYTWTGTAGSGVTDPPQ